jgi:hypothetical protein
MELNRCFRCGRYATQRHHAIYTRDKRYAKWLDMPENLVWLCHDCNVNQKGYVECWEFRKSVWDYKVSQGYDMQAWHESIPMKIKDRF